MILIFRTFGLEACVLPFFQIGNTWPPWKSVSEFIGGLQYQPLMRNMQLTLPQGKSFLIKSTEDKMYKHRFKKIKLCQRKKLQCLKNYGLNNHGHSKLYWKNWILFSPFVNFIFSTHFVESKKLVSGKILWLAAHFWVNLYAKVKNFCSFNCPRTNFRFILQL